LQEVTSNNIAAAPADVNVSLIQPVLRQGRRRILITPLEKRLEAYEKFQELLSRNKSTYEVVHTISKQFGVSQSTVYAWTRGRSPVGRRSGRIIYTKELFYVIGSLLGDGSIYFWKNAYTIWLLGEREFCLKYARFIPSCTSKRRATAYPYRGRNVWFVKFHNAELYFLIRRIRKDLSVLSNLLKAGNISANRVKLIEGFFDAEGCVKVIKESVRRTPKICLDFSNTDANLLDLIKIALKSALGIEATITSQKDKRPNRKMMHHVRIYSKDGVRKFFQHLSTIKNNPAKARYVENWLR
jgi:hypothetical protein